MPNPIDLSQEQLKQIKLFFDQNFGSRAISNHLGISRWLVQKGYKILGIYNSGRKTPRKPIPNNKRCKICNQIKNINKFRKRKKETRISYEVYCLECEKVYNNKRSKKYYNENKEIWINYRRKNRQEINKKIRDRRKNNVKFKLRSTLSNKIYQELRKHLSCKNGKSILKYLPYTVEELKSYLESQFEFWMTWDNWGRYNLKTWDDNDVSTWAWQIDHIKPVSKFKYKSMKDEEFKKCWALENLRPLSAKQNIIEGNRR